MDDLLPLVTGGDNFGSIQSLQAIPRSRLRPRLQKHQLWPGFVDVAQTTFAQFLTSNHTAAGETRVPSVAGVRRLLPLQRQTIQEKSTLGTRV